MATALYRRYRPEAFSEMIGQAHVTEPLMTALRAGRIGHAYLFSGPRGCGKTTSARILARCLNCAEGPTDTPCGTCPSCLELSREGGGSLDVVEIDAASHGGVDDARELRERAVFAPARDRYKIFIIDEAHMVTSGGFNALLKIVEEPPPHVKFIFATTEPEKVIGTIRSRTHHYPFRLIAPGALIDYVQALCESEGVGVEPGVLPLVVRSGGGSVRDTLSILDQLIAGTEGNEVSLERATGLLGFTSAELIDEVVGALATGDAAAAFAATDRVVQTGQDPRRFVEDLLERLRDLIVITATTVQGAAGVFRGVPEDQLQRMFEQAQGFARGQLSRTADTVSKALETMTGATAPRLHLELMMARALLVHEAGGASAAVAAQAVSGAQPGSAANASAGVAASSAVPVSPATSTAHSPATSPAVPAPASAPPVVTAPASAPPVVTAPASAPPAVTAPASAPPAVTAPASAPSAVTAPASASPAVDVIAAMRSARDFLKSEDAAVQRPPIVPLGGHPAPAATPKPQRAETVPPPVDAPGGPTSEAPATAGGLGGSGGLSVSGAAGGSHTPERTPIPDSSEAALQAEPVDFKDLIEIWPDLLEELLENDRDAWNAVRQVQPLELNDNILGFGVASRSDLDAFKANGAGPLREAISAALGMTIKYLPRELPPGVTPQFAARETTEQPPEEPSPSSDTQSPLVSASTALPSVTVESEPGEGLTVDSEAGAAPAADQGFEPEPPPIDEGDDLGTDPGFEPTPEPDFEPTPEPDFESTAEPDFAPVSEPGFEPTPEPDRAPAPKATTTASPGFTRYGESVVRELLGARFIEERPLPADRENTR